MKLPKEIFVRWEEGDEPWLLAQKTLEDLMEAPPDKKIIGVYKLERTVKAETNVTLTTE